MSLVDVDDGSMDKDNTNSDEYDNEEKQVVGGVTQETHEEELTWGGSIGKNIGQFGGQTWQWLTGGDVEKEGSLVYNTNRAVSAGLKFADDIVEMPPSLISLTSGTILEFTYEFTAMIHFLTIQIVGFLNRMLNTFIVLGQVLVTDLLNLVETVLLYVMIYAVMRSEFVPDILQLLNQSMMNMFRVIGGTISSGAGLARGGLQNVSDVGRGGIEGITKAGTVGLQSGVDLAKAGIDQTTRLGEAGIGAGKDVVGMGKDAIGSTASAISEGRKADKDRNFEERKYQDDLAFNKQDRDNDRAVELERIKAGQTGDNDKQSRDSGVDIKVNANVRKMLEYGSIAVNELSDRDKRLLNLYTSDMRPPSKLNINEYRNVLGRFKLESEGVSDEKIDTTIDNMKKAADTMISNRKPVDSGN